MSRGERGSVTLVVAGVLVVLLLLALGLADLARVAVIAARAQTAADAASLAAAQELAYPTGREPADAAAEFAGRNGASLDACSCSPGELEASVTVRFPVGSLLLFPDDRVVLSRARAIVAVPRG